MTKTKKQKIFLLTLTAFMCLIAFLFSSVGYTPKVFADGGEDEIVTYDVTGYSPYVLGLGKGINVLDASHLMDFKQSVVFTENTLSFFNIKWDYAPPSDGGIISSSSFTVEDMLLNFNPSIRASLSVGSFLSIAEHQITNNATVNYSSYNYKYYKNAYHNVRKYKLYIDNFDQSNSLELTQTFEDDLAKLRNGTMTYVQFFSDYGTHLSTSAIYGGTLQMNYTLASNAVAIDSNVSSVINDCVSLPVEQGVMLDIVSSLNTTFNKNYTASDFNESLYFSVSGGDEFAILDTDGFQESYHDWLNSFDPVSTEDFHVNLTYDIVEYANGGLKPLWEILPSEYADIATNMQNAFIELSATKMQAFEDKFKTGNYTQYSGGFGTASNPYILKTYQNLRNISQNMSAHYEMANDIDISGNANWEPIGGYYAASPFTGTFDGCGYNINGLKRTAALPLSNNRSYFGFFGCISTGGVFKNVNFTNVAIGIGVDTYNKNDRVFTGTACGYLYNARIENVNTVSGHIANSNNCTGVVFVGGIIGLARISTIEQCTNNLEVIGGRYSGVAGGVAGYGYDVDFISCTNNGYVKAYGAKIGGCAYAGGILGEKYYSTALDCTFVNCTNTGSILAQKAWGYSWNISTGTSNLCPHATSQIYGG